LAIFIRLGGEDGILEKFLPTHTLLRLDLNHPLEHFDVDEAHLLAHGCLIDLAISKSLEKGLLLLLSLVRYDKLQENQTTAPDVGG
jgi:hypothetical protein